MCIYEEKGRCCLTNQICGYMEEECPDIGMVQEERPMEEIWHVRKDLICKNCGETTAIQYAGTLYPNGLPKKIILKNKMIYGKYANRCHRFPAVGFGGTIPWECTSCHEKGLIGEGEIGLEGYLMLFKEKD